MTPASAATPEGRSRDEPAPAPYLSMLGRLEGSGPISAAHSALVDQAIAVWSKPGFDTLVSLPRLGFTPFAHQVNTAEVVLRRLHGRAILADEVGLGKTIEAGLVLSELQLRGLADQVLILTPPGLLGQWAEELERKFGLPAVVAGSPSGRNAARRAAEAPLLLASLTLARRGELRDILTHRRWDLVIADEAHRIKNPKSQSSRLVRDLRTRYLLLLTATPVENRLDELYHLVNLVQPGFLGTPTEFRRRHGVSDLHTVRELPALQLRLRDVMIRHRRSEVALRLPRRLAETVRVEPGADEARLYANVSNRVRDEGQGASSAHLLALRSLQRLAGSSPVALAPTLQKVGWHDLAGEATQVLQTGKSRRLTDLLHRHAERGEKVVVFTAFRQTLAFLQSCVDDAELPATVYHGGLSRQEKDAAVQRFANDSPVLLTTEAAGEGRNLQFCHAMINFDLPWNPMQIEQRLGRIHRIGQTHDVTLVNLITRSTVEDRLMRVLESKLNLFELVVGELDMILGRVDDEVDFETLVFTAHVQSHDEDEFGERLEQLGTTLADARRDYLDGRDRADQLVAADVSR